MSKKVLLWTLGAIIVLAASVNVGMSLMGNNAERELFLANVYALADEEEDQWIPKYRTGETVVNGITIPCCVRSVDTDKCNFGVVNCIRIL